MRQTADEMVLGWPEREGFQSRFVEASDGTMLRVVEAGRPSGPVVVLLHGAPQMALCWKTVMHLLRGEARLIAPDLRGYGGSELSRNNRYRLPQLVSDLDVVIKDAGGRADVLVGHDWGGPIGWRYAEQSPERMGSMVMANAPHLAAYLRQLTVPDQLLRSWYVMFFQLPFAARLAALNRAKPLMWMMETTGKNVFDSDTLRLYRASLSRPGRAEAVLAYYRMALPRSRKQLRRALRETPIEVPATMLWGDRDAALSNGHPDAVARYVPGLRVRWLRGATHWVPEQCPGEVATAVRAALQAAPRASAPEARAKARAGESAERPHP